MRKTERLQLRLAPEVREYLEIIARRECRSLSAQVEYWVLKQQQRDEQQAMEGEGA